MFLLLENTIRKREVRVEVRVEGFVDAHLEPAEYNYNKLGRSACMSTVYAT